ncbi:MAG: hypothetical protein QOK65_08440, partial [Nitrososphaeraceae archaeon]|nr:hypothetical protein [Nitrososphaeraceae archaeon]
DIDAKVTGENKTSNKIIMHIHSNLNVTVNGRLLIVPNGIGINSTSWIDHSLVKFGTEQNENHNIWHDNSSNVPTTLMNQVVHMLNQPNTETTHWENSLTSGYCLLKVAKLSFSSIGNSTEDDRNYVLKDRKKMILKIED